MSAWGIIKNSTRGIAGDGINLNSSSKIDLNYLLKIG